MVDFEQPTMTCPKCDEELPDFDGFGVLAHEACGYCTHPSYDTIDGGYEPATWRCTICGAIETSEATT